MRDAFIELVSQIDSTFYIYILMYILLCTKAQFYYT